MLAKKKESHFFKEQNGATKRAAIFKMEIA